MDWSTAFSPLSVTQHDTLPPLMLTHLASWGTITAQGLDKITYLQGQLTCDLVSLPKEQVTFGAHCDAKGKVWSAFRAFYHRDGLAMFQPASAIERELTELKKYAIFSKITLEPSQDIALGVIGEQAQSFVATLTDTGQQVSAFDHGTAVKIDAHRWLLLVDATFAKQLVSQAQAPLVAESTWMRLEIENTLPVVTAQQQNEHIPQALNLQALGGISFKKGCYTGQETVARAKYRGINKRALYRLAGNTIAKIDNFAEQELERSVGDNWRSAGQLMAGYQFSDGQAIALAVLPNNLEPETQFRLQSQPEVRWALQPLPYALEDE